MQAIRSPKRPNRPHIPSFITVSKSVETKHVRAASFPAYPDRLASRLFRGLPPASVASRPRFRCPVRLGEAAIYGLRPRGRKRKIHESCGISHPAAIFLGLLDRPCVCLTQRQTGRCTSTAANHAAPTTANPCPRCVIRPPAHRQRDSHRAHRLRRGSPRYRRPSSTRSPASPGTRRPGHILAMRGPGPARGIGPQAPPSAPPARPAAPS